MSIVPVAARWIVVDIEGTTSPTASVHVGLFGYARPRMAEIVARQTSSAEVAEAVAEVKADADLDADAPEDAVVAVLHEWMDEDRKAAPLKTLQGLIWSEGFARGELVPAFFDDVPGALRAWHAAGARLAVFSSGSEASQRAWFGHGPDSDLGELMSGFFDTVTAGPKREPQSYARIAHALGAAPTDILFLSDVVAELDAARAAGWQAVGLVREGEPQTPLWFGAHPRISTFDQIALVEPHLAAAGQRLADASALLAAQGWMQATSGNLSEVLERSPLRVAVTASGRDKRLLDSFDVVAVDDAGNALESGRPGQRPSAESALHAHVAQATGAGSVVHVHALSSVLAARRWPEGIRLSNIELLKALGRSAHDDLVIVPVIANSQDMRELAQRFDESRQDSVPGFVVADHGLYVWGATVEEARHRTEAFEWLFRLALEADY